MISKIKRYIFIFFSLIVCLNLTGCKEKVSLSDYVQIKFSGLNGKGSVDVSVDKSKMAKDTKQFDIPDFGYIVNPTNLNLHNGDSVSIEIFPKSVSDDIKFVDSLVDVKVSGLGDSNILDPFENLSVKYIGIAPFGKILIQNNSENEFLKSIKFICDNPVFLSNGETVKIKAIYDCNYAKSKDIVISPISKTFKVTGLDSYLTDLKSIDKDSVFTAYNKSNDIANSYFKSDFNHICYILGVPYYEFADNTKNLKLSLCPEKIYFLYSKEKELYDDINRLYFLYSFSFTNQRNTKPVKGYLAVGFFNSFIPYNDPGNVAFNNGCVCYVDGSLDIVKREILQNQSNYTVSEFPIDFFK